MITLKRKFAAALFALLASSPAVAASLTRLANTTTYTVNTAWNSTSPSFFTFPVCPNFGAVVVIPEIDIFSSANPATKLAGTLWLFNTVPSAPSIIADNANFVLAAADFANLVGGQNGIPFALASGQGAGAANSGVSLSSASLGAPLAVSCGPTNNLFGMVEVTNAYVPVSGEVLTINVKTVY